MEFNVQLGGVCNFQRITLRVKFEKLSTEAQIYCLAQIFNNP